MEDIYENRMLLTSVRDNPDGWELVSGMWSPFYIQLRILSSYPNTLHLVGKAMKSMIEQEIPEIDRVVGIAFAGIPIATAVSMVSDIPACHTRKVLGVRNQDDLEEYLSEYGQHSLVEGVIESGDSLCIVDDLVTGMESKLLARAQIQAEIERRELENVHCEHVAVIVDRQQGAEEKAASEGIHLHSLIRLIDEGLPMIEQLMKKDEYHTIMEYLQEK
jgi:orotate phosphoribosyltransferase